ncbi:restriction endonuclease subunit S [Geobacillus sp. FSL W8-0466]|uniref:restriction endonuclease subunit S n=1 Tax=Geobacillus sp. FSL W8-0466 TaxID=2975350 RepID=UPI0030DBD8C8
MIFAHLWAGNRIACQVHVVVKSQNFIVRIPESIAIQNRIVSILSSIDDKIELNLKINETLEEMAMTLYKHWFVDFGPFQDGEFVESELGMIPKGWRVISCYDLANYINGKAFKTNQLVDNDGLPVIKIAELKSGITNSTKFYNGDIEPKYLLQNGDILFAWSASLGVFIWAKGKAVLNQHIFNVKPNGTLSKSMIYFTLKNIIQEFIEIAASRATTMGHITKEHLIDKKIALPPDELLVKVDEKMSNYYQMILSNMLEVERLTQIRDYLLPRLLSGEIDVSKAEKQVEEVL